MELVELSKKEFQQFADKHPQISFYQTYYWAELKEKNNWESYYVGLKDKENKIKCGALLLAKNTPLKKKMFYSPRGLLVDYKDKKLLTEFTEQLKKFIKEKNGIFLKIDPYVNYKQRDIDGKIIEDGFDNSDCYQNLIDLGYRHFGFNLYQDTLQPRWMFTTTTKNRTLEEIMKEMDPKTRQLLRKNERLGMTVREIKIDELDKFKKIMEHTSERREFIDRPFSYYQNMWETLGKGNMIKVLLAELNTVQIIHNLEEEKEKEIREKKDRLYKKEHNINKMNEEKFEQKQKVSDQNIARIEKKIEEIKKLKEEHGEVITLGGILFLIYGNEVLSLVGGSYHEFMEFQSAYNVHFAGLKYALENNYERYNFYGITGDFNEQNPLYGLYLFKRGFGGQVEELLGEFDLIINKPYYILYKLSFTCYHTLKHIKAKLRHKKSSIK